MVVYTRGEAAGVMYILLSGRLGSLDHNDEIAYIDQYDVFGMSALKAEELREETVLTEEPSQLLCLVGEHYRDILQEFHLFSNVQLKLLSHVHFFSKLVLMV
jgi:signal-transduction protein with cAMP-binding, CBS, and nucleotidyltransferase domain